KVGNQWIEVTAGMNILTLELLIEVVAANRVLAAVHEDREIRIIGQAFCCIRQTTDATNTLQLFPVGRIDLLAPRDSPVDIFQLQKAHGGTHFAHLAVNAGSDNRNFVHKAEVLEMVY